MAYLGTRSVDDVLTFTVNTHAVATGVGTDADSVPTFRVYEDETGTAIANGSMAKLDDANTVGFYSEQLTLSAANGYEDGKSYSIYIAATVSSIAATTSHNFQVDDIDVNVVAVGGTAQTAGDLAALITTADSAIDAVQTDLDNGTDGLGALKTLIDTVNTDLSNGTDGLGALKTLIDTVNTDLSNGTDGLGALKTLIDAVQTTANAVETDTQDLQTQIGTAGAGLTEAGGTGDHLTALPEVNANVQKINDVTITGDGSGTPFDV